LSPGQSVEIGSHPDQGALMLPERNAEYWLKKAEEARTRADGMHDPVAIESMLDIASKYDVMAQRAEGRQVRTQTNPSRRS
jgi:hypothetical protein